MKTERYKEMVGYTLGKKKAPLVLKNGNVVMVQSNEILKADIAVCDGYIVGVGKYEGVEEIDLKGKFVAPGFVDSHLHFESTMASPRELVYYASLCGTTTFIADPHEAANVAGIEGIEYMIGQTENSMADVYYMMPSCVPCKDNEDNGVILGAEEMKAMLDNPNILGLGEVMDVNAVIDAKPDMIEKLSLFENRIADGHGLGLDDKGACAYAMANIRTDHESSFYEEAIREVRNGMYVHIREGSAARNLKNIVEGIVDNNTDTSRFTFCTDDKHIEDIIREGHISHNIRKSIDLGIDIIEAYKMASCNAAQCYNLKDIGMIAPGKKANLVILSDLVNVKVEEVYYEGRKIPENMTLERVDISELSESLTDTVRIDWFDSSMLQCQNSRYAIGIVPGEILTEKIDLNDIGQKKYYSDINRAVNKAVVIERHHNTGKCHTAKVVGYGLENGAIASSVSHDSHNVVVIGDNDRDMMVAIERLKEMKGGYVLVKDGNVFESIPLPVMGLISDLNSDEINRKLHSMISEAHKMGVDENVEPFIVLSFIALPVIPQIRITPRGLYDVVRDRYLD